MLGTSISVCALIFTDKDIRGRKYRKYELSVQVPSILNRLISDNNVQFSSMFLELWICMGVPIFMPNYRIVYMAGYIPLNMDSVLYTVSDFP